MQLVIVESPAKGKTIEKYLGKDFTVRASVGHIRDLEKKKMGINLETFEPEYIVSADKKKIVNELKRVAKKAETVWIATDQDREGEAIGWHLCEALGLDSRVTKRITYNEVTKKGLQEAIKNPTTLDHDIVDAQQARRVLDRIVGFEVSPVLWRKIPGQGGLSAGRVQSVAVRLVVDKEKEIEAFNPKESWKLKANLTHEKKALQVELAKIDGKAAKITKQEKIDEILTTLGVAESKHTKDKKGAIVLSSSLIQDFEMTDLVKRETKRSPAAPFTTSTLQQEASRKFGFGVKQTMGIAQKLYQDGLITYMRTDSVNLSADAISMSLEFIEKQFGPGYAVPKGRKYKTKDSAAQEAHEAIRPSYIDRTPDTITLSGTDLKLYTLIWNRTLASQMKEAEVETTTYSFAPNKAPNQEWQVKGQVITFDGFMKLYIEDTDDETEEDGDNKTLPKIEKGETLPSKDILGLQNFSRPPGRYTEAALVKKLESEGIGRPSTYAPTISTIIDRGYVEKEKKYLHPTTLASVVTGFLETNFAPMMDYKFTAKVESEFDEIAAGKIQWQKMLKGFYKDFHPLVEKAGGAERATGERQLGIHPKSGKPVLARMGRYGPMIQIGQPEEGSEEKPEYASVPRNMNIATITLEESLELFKLPRVLGKMDGEELKASVGRFGPYVQLGKLYASMPKKFEEDEEAYDPFSITFEQGEILMKAKQVAEANKYINQFESGIEVLNGRYGPYIKFEKKNYKLTKEQKEAPEKLTEAQCTEIIEAQKK